MPERDSLSDRGERPLDEEGLRAARAVAGWYLGYSSWADNIVGAYLHPEEALKNLRYEKETT